MSDLKKMEESVCKMNLQNKKLGSTGKFLLYLSTIFLFLILFHIQASPLISSSSKLSSLSFFSNFNNITTTINPSKNIEKLRDSITFLPLLDQRFDDDNRLQGHTWYMSSLNDTHEENEPLHLYFPSEASKGRILCMKGHAQSDVTKNSYALAFPEALPDSAIFLKGLTFVSETYYSYENIWHGESAMSPFVAWSMKNQCLKPTRWVLTHRGQIMTRTSQWLADLMKANFGNFELQTFENENTAYCFENAVLMRHDSGGMGHERKLQVSDLLRCKARKACGLRRGREVNKIGAPIIRITLWLRRGSRSFKDLNRVKDIFAEECQKIEGCVLNVSQTEDLNFCDQVRVMTNTDIVISAHGAQLTNMIFMDRGSSVMELFPKGWLEHAGTIKYAFQWTADASGMRHEGQWFDPEGNECPTPEKQLDCFFFLKNGQVGHNETYFREWSTKILNQVSLRKKEEGRKEESGSSSCDC